MKKNLKVIDMILAPSDRKIDYLNCLRGGNSLLASSTQHLPPQPHPSSSQVAGSNRYINPVQSSAGVRLVTAQVPEKVRVPGAPSLLGRHGCSLKPFHLDEIVSSPLRRLPSAHRPPHV